LPRSLFIRLHRQPEAAALVGLNRARFAPRLPGPSTEARRPEDRRAPQPDSLAACHSESDGVKAEVLDATCLSERPDFASWRDLDIAGFGTADSVRAKASSSGRKPGGKVKAFSPLSPFV
jgi:hypothetical protein